MQIMFVYLLSLVLHTLTDLHLAFRFCPADYLPFDPKDLDKYVERNIIINVWEVRL